MTNPSTKTYTSDMNLAYCCDLKWQALLERYHENEKNLVEQNSKYLTAKNLLEQGCRDEFLLFFYQMVEDSTVDREIVLSVLCLANNDNNLLLRLIKNKKEYPALMVELAKDVTSNRYREIAIEVTKWYLQELASAPGSLSPRLRELPRRTDEQVNADILVEVKKFAYSVTIEHIIQAKQELTAAKAL